MKKLLLCLIVIPVLMIGMGAVSDLEKEAEKIADEIAVLRKPKQKKEILNFLQLSKQPTNMDTRYSGVSKLCKGEYVPLMKKLIESEVISANAYYMRKGFTCTLLTDAISYAINHYDYEIGMVRLLLEKGAETNQPALPYCYLEDYPSNSVKQELSCSPLLLATQPCTTDFLPLISLLLQHKARPNTVEQGKTAFMNVLFLYRYFLDEQKRPTEKSTKVYSVIEEFLQRGASVKIPSLCDGQNISLTPVQYAQKYQRAELLELFNQYAKS